MKRVQFTSRSYFFGFRNELLSLRLPSIAAFLFPLRLRRSFGSKTRFVLVPHDESSKRRPPNIIAYYVVNAFLSVPHTINISDRSDITDGIVHLGLVSKLGFIGIPQRVVLGVNSSVDLKLSIRNPIDVRKPLDSIVFFLKLLCKVRSTVLFTFTAVAEIIFIQIYTDIRK